jgi:hypothetical protein
MKRIFPLSFYNPLTLVGAAVAVVSFGLIVFLMLLETVATRQKPYMGVVAFVILPGFLITGLTLIAAGVLREYRRNRQKTSEERSLPIINLNDPKSITVFTVFSVGTILLLMFTAFGSFKAYEYTESDQFCGVLCHKVMEPEYAAYRFSPHARVGCVQCHIGSGADWFVRSKISGLYQVYATVLNIYPRPIPTPVTNLRPAQETCEQCHWPKYFYREKLKVGTYFLSDEHNIPWTLTMLLRIGGGSIETGPTSGIHWHMNILNEVTYVAADPQRLVIPLVTVRSPDGSQRTYRSTLRKEAPNIVRRRMDCLDCHNRPTHIYHHPSESVNQLLGLGRIDPRLPNIKSLAVKTLDEPYPSRETAILEIRRRITEFYQGNYPEIARSMKEDVERAVVEIQKIYERNYFPGMKVSWKAFPDHIGHLHSPGCFRCHDGNHVNDDGKVLSKDCNLCHVIIAQQFEKQSPRFSLSGLDYRHPGEVGDAWKELNCSDCHGRQ